VPFREKYCGQAGNGGSDDAKSGSVLCAAIAAVRTAAVRTAAEKNLETFMNGKI
jgi:hypothetical protein